MKTSVIITSSELEKFVKPQVSVREQKATNEEIEQPEERSSKDGALRSAIEEGLSSGVAEGFDPAMHLSELKKTFQHA